MELAAKAVALGASFSLIASLVHDWGFFFALSLTFLKIPSTLSDHVRSAAASFCVHGRVHIAINPAQGDSITMG